MTQARPIYQVAFEIMRDWKHPSYGAVPYLNAMLSIQSIDDNYGFDSARSIVNYFLANAGGWRGDTAKRVKAELRKLVR